MRKSQIVKNYMYLTELLLDILTFAGVLAYYADLGIMS
jgi:hypothetical protein